MQLSGDRLIGYHRSREDYTDSPDTTLQFAYGDQRYLKMTYELQHSDDSLKQKTLQQLVEDFALCDSVSLALVSSDLLTVLLQLLQSPIQNLRLLTATIVRRLCAVPLGRKTLIARNAIPAIQSLVHDPLPKVKKQAYDALIDFAEYTEGIVSVIEKGHFLVQLVDKLIEEKNPDILLRAVILLKVLTHGEVGTPKLLQTQAISRLVALVNHNHELIQYQVCLALANISFNQQGKAAIVAQGHIRKVSPSIRDPNPRVREAVILLLASLAQLNQGKIQILQFCPFENFSSLLADEPPTALNCVQLIANIAQHPRGRQLATKLIPNLQSLTTVERKYIDQTIQVIKWTP